MSNGEIPYPIMWFASLHAAVSWKQHPAMAVVVILRGCESFYYNLPCFPVLDARLTRIRMASMNESGKQGVAFDEFCRPALLHGVTLPQRVTPIVSFDIQASLIY